MYHAASEPALVSAAGEWHGVRRLSVELRREAVPKSGSATEKNGGSGRGDSCGAGGLGLSGTDGGGDGRGDGIGLGPKKK